MKFITKIITGWTYRVLRSYIRFPTSDCKGTTGCGKLASKGHLTRRPRFTLQEDSWYSFLLEAELTPGL
jgi:hypothetical protein